ncbi:MAG TPA: hypothetical protein VGK25_11410, partial [Ignavibacteria bacterium]
MAKETYRNLFVKYKIHLILFWVFLYAALIIRQTNDKIYLVTVIANFTFLVVMALYSCFILFFLLPRYGYNRRFPVFFPVLIISFIVVVIVNAYVDQIVFVNYAVHPVKSG